MHKGQGRILSEMNHGAQVVLVSAYISYEKCCLQERLLVGELLNQFPGIHPTAILRYSV